jgi:hypothetical protein
MQNDGLQSEPLRPLWILNYGKDSATSDAAAVGIPPKLWSRRLSLVHRCSTSWCQWYLSTQSKHAVAKDFGISVVLDVCCCCSYVSFIPLYIVWSWLFNGHTDFWDFSEERQTNTSASNSLTGYEYVIVGKWRHNIPSLVYSH